MTANYWRNNVIVLQHPRDPFLRAGVMPPVYCAVYQGGALVGDFDLVEGVDCAGSVRALKERFKVVRGAELAGVEPWHMTIFGPWAAKPLVAMWTAALADEDASRDPAATLGALVGDKQCAYFLVRITAPPPAAAAGASVLGWKGYHRCRSQAIILVLSPVLTSFVLFCRHRRCRCGGSGSARPCGPI